MKTRAKVRLRLDRGTALLRQFGLTSVLCALVDLSESGCHCLMSLDDLDEETAAAWKGVLTQGRVVTLEMTDPPELRGLLFKQAEVRWVRHLKGGDVDFGLELGHPEPEQKEILARALLSYAAGKLRRSSAKTAAAGAEGAGVVTPLPGMLADAPPMQATEVPGPPRPGVPRGLRLAGPARQRPSRQRVYLPAVFEFCDGEGNEWEQGLHQGRTVDVSEGGLLLEGPAPVCCQPKELMGLKAHVRVTIRADNYDVKGLCSVRSAVPSHHMKDGWLYGIQFVEMSQDDRQRLRDIYALAAAQKRPQQ